MSTIKRWFKFNLYGIFESDISILNYIYTATYHEINDKCVSFTSENRPTVKGWSAGSKLSTRYNLDSTWSVFV